MVTPLSCEHWCGNRTHIFNTVSRKTNLPNLCELSPLQTEALLKNNDLLKPAGVKNVFSEIQFSNATLHRSHRNIRPSQSMLQWRHSFNIYTTNVLSTNKLKSCFKCQNASWKDRWWFTLTELLTNSKKVNKNMGMNKNWTGQRDSKEGKHHGRSDTS